MYSDKKIEAKAAHIAELYPNIKWPDILELIPQVMEIVEIKAISCAASKSWNKKNEKHKTAIKILNKIIEKVNISENIQKAIPLIIILIDQASKGKFAINKEQK